PQAPVVEEVLVEGDGRGVHQIAVLLLEAPLREAVDLAELWLVRFLVRFPHERHELEVQHVDAESRVVQLAPELRERLERALSPGGHALIFHSEIRRGNVRARSRDSTESRSSSLFSW